MFDQLELRPMELPESFGLRRSSVQPVENRRDDFEQKYDFLTLVYAAAETERGLVLICPKLLNFEDLLRRGTFSSAAGKHALRRIRRFKRHDEVDLAGRPEGSLLTFDLPGLHLDCTIERLWPAATGRRVLATLSKDNDPAWIEDWASHYVRNQGSRAVLFFDNGSAYAPEVALEALRRVKGLEAARVISVPSLYGAVGKTRRVGRALFLQSALLNLTRLAYLPKARSVIECDIDEIAISDPGAPTLHQAAEQSWLGFAAAKAYWRAAKLPEGASDALPSFGDHILNWSPERSTKEKWCVRPDGLLGKLRWDVHGLARYQFNRLALRKDIRFLHCQNIATDWKYKRAVTADPAAFEDPQTIAELTRMGLRR